MNKYKQNKFQTILSILSVAIGLAVILAIQISTTNNIKGLEYSSKSYNCGDICISPYENSINEKQQNVLEEIKKQGLIDYTCATWVKSNAKYGNKSSTIIIRFIQSDNYPFYAKEKYGILNSKEPNIILSMNQANQLNCKKGDLISILDPQSGNEIKYNVIDIVEVDKENDLDMNLFGYGFVDYQHINNFYSNKQFPMNKIYIKYTSNNENEINEELSKVFSEEEIVTSNKLYNEMELEVRSIMKSISIIGILAALMGGIGIACTAILNVQKQQKELCVLRVFGMSGNKLNKMIVLDSCLIGVISFLIALPICVAISYIINNYLYTSTQFQFYSEYVFDILLVFVFTIVISVLFSYIPIKVTNSLSPVMIIREEEFSKKVKFKIYKPISIIAIVITIGSVLYYKSVLICLYLFVILLLAIISYLFMKLFIKFILLLGKLTPMGKMTPILVLKRLEKQTKKLLITILVLSIGLISIGLTINISGSILSGVEQTIQNQVGFNTVLVSKEENRNEINAILEDTKSIESYSQSLKSDVRIIEHNNSSFQVVTDNINNLDDKKFMKNLTIEGLDLNEQDLGLEIVEGRSLSKDDYENVAIINSYLAEIAEIHCGDTIKVKVDNVVNNYKIIGIYNKQLINTSEIKVPLKSLTQSIGWTSLTYYMNIEDDSIDETIFSLYESIDDCFIININDLSPSLYKTIRQQVTLFTAVSIISILSFVLFMTNIILIDMIERKKEFMLYGVFGAVKQRLIRMILFEAVISGTIASIISYILCNVFTNAFLNVFLDIDYVRPSVDFILLLLVGIGVSLVSILIVIPQIEISKLKNLLREY
ncbi:ABC transporter permease [Anaerosporobacter sp.]|uniref:ABC transporter permease n=1 Tax=Anaerosporobacter sp. TaxID=1872529 RepID=UPI00286EF234|nr:FtsX-like permease family protein [Anaerosporobacter sp.]